MNYLYKAEGTTSRRAETEHPPAMNEIVQKNDSREAVYQQHFVTLVERVSPPAVFIQQVNGYGLQVFAQMTSFSKS